MHNTSFELEPSTPSRWCKAYAAVETRLHHRLRSNSSSRPSIWLEYMAAEKPIVTTPIPDVLEPYEPLVYAGDGPEAFIAACEQALGESEVARARRVAGMRAVVEQTSWEATTASMEEKLERAAWRRQLRRRPPASTAVESRRSAS